MSADHVAGPPEDAQARPVTGDDAVDRLLRDLDDRLAAAPEDQVEAVTEAHRQLQARLAGQVTPTPPGQARPGPR